MPQGLLGQPEFDWIYIFFSFRRMVQVLYVLCSLRGLDHELKAEVRLDWNGSEEGAKCEAEGASSKN